MGTYYLLKNTPPGADPLGPENTLSFMLSRHDRRADQRAEPLHGDGQEPHCPA